MMKANRFALLVALLAMTGCAQGSNAVVPSQQSSSASHDAIGGWTQYPLTITVGFDVVAGSDGDLYSYGYGERDWRELVKMDPQGNQQGIPFDGVIGCPAYETITLNPDHNIFATELLPEDGETAIDIVTPGGGVTQFGMPYNDCTIGIVSGSDGNVWIVHNYGIGRVTPGGVYTEFGGGPFGAIAYLSRIARGPDKNLWFNSDTPSGNTLIRISVHDGSQTRFVLPNDASNLTEGPDGTLFMMGQGRIYQVNTDGTTTAYPVKAARTGLAMIKGTKGRLFWVDQQRVFFYGTSTHRIENQIAAPENGEIAVSEDHTQLWLVRGNQTVFPTPLGPRAPGIAYALTL